MFKTRNAATLLVDDVEYETMVPTRMPARRASLRKDPRQVAAVIPGVIRTVSVHAGRPVRRGDSVLVMEAMKMENTVVAPQDGMVKAIHVQPGDMVPKGRLLFEME